MRGATWGGPPRKTYVSALAAKGGPCSLRLSQNPLQFCVLRLPSPRTSENPAFYATWAEEGENRRICKIAAATHRRSFERRVLDRVGF